MSPKGIFNIGIKWIIALRAIFYKNRLTNLQVGDFYLKAPALHPLGVYMRKSPTYSRNFPRIVSLVSQTYPKPTIIDVGANIGDTVALVHSTIQCPMVCIEGDDFYFKLLQENIKQFKDVTAHKYILGDSDGVSFGNLDTSLGSGMVKQSENSTIPINTLDYFVKKNPEYSSAKILKIDTDGFDGKILRGAKKYLTNSKPVLFFEFDHYLLKENGDNGLKILEDLEKNGYDKIFFYDNNGRLLVTTSLKEKCLISELYRYTYKKTGAFAYYDVCVFHKQDDTLAATSRTSELSIS